MSHISLYQKLTNETEYIIYHPSDLHRFILKAEESIETTGQLPDTQLWHFLEWRRSLNEIRFDHYHPEFTKLFKLEKPVPIIPTPITPNSVPEPNSLVLMIIGLFILKKLL